MLVVGEDFAPQTASAECARNEAGLLLAFDPNRARIYAAATEAYKRERKASYELAAADF